MNAPSACLSTLLILLLTPDRALSGEQQQTPSSPSPAARTGIDPTDIQSRIEGAYTYNERDSGVTRHNLNLRFEREWARRTNIRLDVPLIYADVPNGSSESGIGDIGVRLNYRYRNTPGYSALAAATVTLDTASERALGDDTVKLTGAWVHSWRRGAWLLSAAAFGTWSESGEQDAAGVAPFFAYQPMGRYLSYASVAVPIVRDLDDDESIAIAALRLGKVFAEGHIIYLGTRYDLSDNADDDLVITLGYRHLL